MENFEQHSLNRVGPHVYKAHKTCPYCDSVYIEDDHCESCGRYFNVNSMGEVLGDRSFYSLREKYWEDIGPLARQYDFLESQSSPEFDDYKRKLLFRYNTLLDYFYSPDKYDYSNYNVHMMEFCELIKEIFRCGIDEDLIWKRYNSKSELQGSLYDEIGNSIFKIKEGLSEERPSLRERVNRGLNYKVADLFSIGSIIFFSLTVGFVITAGLGLYRYLLLR